MKSCEIVRLTERVEALERELAALKAVRAVEHEQPDIASAARAMGINIKANNLVSEADAARLLDLSPRTLRNWHYTSQPLEAVKLNGRRHYRLTDIEARLTRD